MLGLGLGLATKNIKIEKKAEKEHQKPGKVAPQHRDLRTTENPSRDDTVSMGSIEKSEASLMAAANAEGDGTDCFRRTVSALQADEARSESSLFEHTGSGEGGGGSRAQVRRRGRSTPRGAEGREVRARRRFDCTYLLFSLTSVVAAVPEKLVPHLLKQSTPPSQPHAPANNSSDAKLTLPQTNDRLVHLADDRHSHEWR